MNSGPPLSDIVDGTLLLRTRHNGRQARVADQLAHELQHNMLTVEAGIEACLLGVPYLRGKEAEDGGHTRILIDISALPDEFLTSAFALNLPALGQVGWQGCIRQRPRCCKVERRQNWMRCAALMASHHCHPAPPTEPFLSPGSGDSLAHGRHLGLKMAYV